MARINLFPVDKYPPYLSSAVWPTAPYIPSTKFVPAATNLKFVPQYNWGCPEDMPDPDCACNATGGDLGAVSERKKARLKKRAAKLRAKATKIEKKAGILKKVKSSPGVKKATKEAFQMASTAAKKSTAPAVEEEETAAPMPTPEGVPQNAEEGASNMKLIIGGTLALLAAIGIGFAAQQRNKKSAARTASVAKPPPVPAISMSFAAPAPLPAPVPAPVRVAATPDEVAAELAEMPISANPRGLVMMVPVRPRR